MFLYNESGIDDSRENMINQIKHLVKTFNTKRVSDFSRNNTI